MTDDRIYALLGAVAGGAVTAAFWLGIGVSWWGLVPTLLGAILGAGCGLSVGTGRVHQSWAGRAAALLVGAIAIAFANVCVLAILLAYSH